MRSSFVLHNAAAVCLIAAVPSAHGATLRVPSDYVTINGAMDAADVGDTVLVAPGVYDQYETRIGPFGALQSSVAFVRAGVVLRSEGGAANTVLTMHSTVGFPTVVQNYGAAGDHELTGFTVTSDLVGPDCVSFGYTGRCVVHDCVFRDFGTGNSDEVALGSVSADLEVYNCRFENINGASGAAIGQTSGTLLVEDCEFTNVRNSAFRVQYDDAIPHATSLTVRRCSFVGNTVQGGGGGALGAVRYSTVLIEECWFEGNRSIGGSSSGGAVQLGGTSTDAVIRNCTFAGNLTDIGKGGAVWTSCLTTVVEGNTFFGNSQGIDWAPGGAAVYFTGTGAGVLRNNVVASSTGDQAVGISTVSLQTGCNVYWNNPLGNTSGFAPSPTDLAADPQLCDAPALDFRVNGVSPCLPGNGHPSCTERIGAWGPGCGIVSVDPASWGTIKSGFRRGSEEAKP